MQCWNTWFKGNHKSRIVIITNWRRFAVSSTIQERFTTPGRHAVSHSSVVAAWGSQLRREDKESDTWSLFSSWCLCTYQPPPSHPAIAVKTYTYDHYTTSRYVKLIELIENHFIFTLLSLMKSLSMHSTYITHAYLIDVFHLLLELLFSVIGLLDQQKRDSLGARSAIRWLEIKFRHGSRFIRSQRPHERTHLPLIKYPKRKDKEAW